MKKIVFILLFIPALTVSSQWKQHGNSESIRAHDTAIKDFVITEDSKYIYTLDKNGVIKKWDYATGDSISMRKVKPIQGEYIPPNWIHLSSDGKTYCLSNFRFVHGGSSENNNICTVYIFNIENGMLSDSIQYTFLTGGLSPSPKANTISINYESNNNRLFIYITYSVEFYPFYVGSVNGGSTSIHLKNKDQWLTKRCFDGNQHQFLQANDLLFLSTTKSFYSNAPGDQSNYNCKINHDNLIYYIDMDSIVSLNSYYREYTRNSNYEKGKIIDVTSSFLSNDNKQLVMNYSNMIYKTELQSRLIDSVRLNMYPAINRIKLTNAVDDRYFFLTIVNSINIHEIASLDYYNTFTFNNIDTIDLLKNSIDRQYIFFTDLSGELHRISNPDIFELRANFVSPDTNIIVDDTAHFYDRSLGDPDSYFWDFGDGYISNEKDPVHFYTKTGNYNIRLIVTKNGVCDTITKESYIYVLPVLKAGFIFDYIASIPGKVIFTDKSSGIIDSVLWDFDDGTFSKDPIVSHIYTYPDKYNVKLKVFSKTLTDSVTKIVPIYIADKAIDKSRIQYEFTDTTHEEGGEAIKGWEEDGGEIVYHINQDSSTWHHGAFRNFVPDWNVSTTFNKEFLVRQSGGVYTFLSDTSITNFDKNGAILHSRNYRKSTDILSVRNSGNTIIPTCMYSDKFLFDEIENGKKIIRSVVAGTNYTYSFQVSLTIHNIIAYVSDSVTDFLVNYSFIAKQYSGNTPGYEFTINNFTDHLLPFIICNDFIRLNDSLLVFAGNGFLQLVYNMGINKDSSIKSTLCKVKTKSDLKGYSFNSLLKLNDTAFVAAGSYNGSPAYVVANADGVVLDSLVISERTGSFNYVSLTPDNNLLLSGYRKKYHHYISPYFVKTDDKFVNSLLTSVYDPGELQPLAAISSLKCSPNPVTGKATVSFNLKEDAPVGFKVFDLYGNCVVSGKAGNCPAGANTFDVSFDGQPIGCYFLVLEANGSTCSEKIVYLRE